MNATLRLLLFGDNDPPGKYLFYASLPNGTGDVSFTGELPNLTMTITEDCPFLGISPFLAPGVYYLSNYRVNTNNQVFIVMTDTVFGMAVYSSQQTDDVAAKILKYLRDPLYQYLGFVAYVSGKYAQMGDKISIMGGV